MRIAFGTDTDGVLASAVVGRLVEQGHAVEVVARPGWWPDVGRRVAERVTAGEADLGVVCCWTGTGVCMAANKVKGARAALCCDSATASGARRWNDANVLALSVRATSETVAGEIVDAFLAGRPDPDELDAITAIE